MPLLGCLSAWLSCRCDTHVTDNMLFIIVFGAVSWHKKVLSKLKKKQNKNKFRAILIFSAWKHQVIPQILQSCFIYFNVSSGINYHRLWKVSPAFLVRRILCWRGTVRHVYHNYVIGELLWGVMGRMRCFAQPSQCLLAQNQPCKISAH